MLLRICQISLVLATPFIFVSCSGSGGTPAYNPDVGPFDENGNYVEAWADNPPKRGSSRKVANPKPAPKPVAKSLPKAKPVTRPITVAKPVVRPVAPPKIVSTPKPLPAPTPKPIKVTPKPTPKPVVAKPKTTRHIVKKGDTLYGLSKRYGVSISAIKRANGISGTRIITGKSYVIPR